MRSVCDTADLLTKPLILFGVACLFASPSTLASDIDWQKTGTEVAQTLSEYLQVDTVNPPGNELDGAQFLADKLSADGIATQIIESSPGRGNLIARLKGTTDEPALCFLSHIDIAPFEAERWPEGIHPLSGKIEDGWVWGRGALDMKGMGALQTMVMQLLARQKVPLKRDVVMIAVADEEIDNTGVRFLLENHWEDLRCGDVINEGGIGIYDLFFEDQTAYSISVGEKGVLWLKMIATGNPGHGSTPRPDEAPERLRLALNKLAERDAPISFHPSFLEAIAISGAQQGGFAGWIMQRPFWAKRLLVKRIASNPVSKAVLTDTVHLTGLGGAIAPNVVPGETWAILDCRLLPGTSPDTLLNELIALVDDPHVRFEVLSKEEAAVSPWKDEAVYDALRKHAVDALENTVAIPVLSVGFTDSIYFRRRGVRAYGLAPFRVSGDDLATMHGDGERLHTEELLRGVQILYGVVKEVASDTQ